MKRFILLSAGIMAALLGFALWPQAALCHDALTTTVQFDREIVHILNSHCVMCHDANGPVFPLNTYEQTFLVRRQIRVDAISRHMAPWAAVPGYGDFANDNSLTLREIQFLVSWAEGWGPRNNGASYAQVAVTGAQPKMVEAHIDFSHWELGDPNLRRQLSANTIAPQQPDEVKRTVIDLDLKSERWLRGLEYKPSDRRVVRAAFFTIQETGQWVGSWTPWYGFVSLPKGLAYRLPAGSHIAAEIYYRGAKEQVIEHGALGLYFADKPSPAVISDLVLETKSEGSADAASQRFRAAVKLMADTHVLALRPDIQPGLKSLEVSARTPDGGTQVILFAKDFPMDWPTPYIFKDPVALPKGSELSATAYYTSAGAAPQPAGIRLTVSGYQGSIGTLKNEPAKARMQEATSRRFKLTGTVQSVNANQHSLTVQHNAIPGFMGAMTMAYEIGKQEDLAKVTAGDQIQADVVVSGSEMHLENIKVTSHSK